MIEAATALFAERGYAGTSIADIAEMAGVRKPSVLYHFVDKEMLWKTVVDTLWAKVDLFYAERWPRSREPSRELIETMLALFIEAALRWPAYVRIPFIEGATPSWRSEWLVDKHFGAHVAATDLVIRACQRRNLMPPGDPAHLQGMLTSSISVFVAQAAMWDRAFGRKLDDIEALTAQVRLILNLTFRSETIAESV